MRVGLSRDRVCPVREEKREHEPDESPPPGTGRQERMTPADTGLENAVSHTALYSAEVFVLR